MVFSDKLSLWYGLAPIVLLAGQSLFTVSMVFDSIDLQIKRGRKRFLIPVV